MKKLEQKDYPLAYPSDVRDVIEAMAIHPSRVSISGSASLSAIQYPADVDAVDSSVRVRAPDFQRVIRDVLSLPLCYVSDIKCGAVPDWIVIPESATVRHGKVEGYDVEACRTRLDHLYDDGIISPDEYEHSRSLLRDNPTTFQFLEAKKEMRFHIIRWKPADVLDGNVVLRDDSVYPLEKGVKDQSAMMKLDVIGFVANQLFRDFSMIYSRKQKDLGDIGNSLRCDILYYQQKGESFKALKRIFALCRHEGSKKWIDKALPLLNGDLGLLYSLQSDCDALLSLMELADVLPVEKIRFEIDQFKTRVSQLYQIPAIQDQSLLRWIDKVESANRRELEKGIEGLRERLAKELETHAVVEMKDAGFLPLRKEWLP
jgi:hypothetical protein